MNEKYNLLKFTSPQSLLYKAHNHLFNTGDVSSKQEAIPLYIIAKKDHLKRCTLFLLNTNIYLYFNL